MLGGLSPVVGRFRKSLRLWRRESFRLCKDVLRRVHVPVMTRSTITACPFPFGKLQFLILPTALMAELRARIEPVHPHKRPAIPFRLVPKQLHELRPRGGMDEPVEHAFAALPVSQISAVPVRLRSRFPRHIPYRQRLHADELVLFYQPVGQLVLEVLAVVAEPGVRMFEPELLLPIPVGAFHPMGQHPLLADHIRLQSLQPVSVADLLARAEREEILDAQVDADTALGPRFRLDIRSEQEHEIIPATLASDRPAGQLFEWETRPIALAKTDVSEFSGQRVPVAVHVADGSAVAERLHGIVSGREARPVPPMLALAEVRAFRLGEIAYRLAHRIRRQGAIPKPRETVLQVGDVRILGVRIRLPVIRVKCLDLLVVDETAGSEALFQQRLLGDVGPERNALRHMSYGHSAPRSLPDVILHALYESPS